MPEGLFCGSLCAAPPRAVIESALILYLLAAGLVMFPYQWLGNLFTQDEQTAGFLGLGILRILFSGVMLLLAFHMGIRKTLAVRGGCAGHGSRYRQCGRNCRLCAAVHRCGAV